MNEKLETTTAASAALSANGAVREMSPMAVQLEMQWNALLGQKDLLREEIERGQECLNRARSELAESRAQLEEWPAYEGRCGGNCLPQLTESVVANRRVERFLTAWLRRRQNRLEEVNEALGHFAK